MTQRELLSFYEDRKGNFSELLTSKKKQINVISNLRIITALFILIAGYFAFSSTWLWYAEIPLLFLFTVLVKRHSRLFNEKVHLENLVKINVIEGQALKGEVGGLLTGSEFIDPHHPYSHDLDIFGEGSLFQSVNRCNTIHGKKEMARRLSYPLPAEEDIYRYQRAVQELATKPDFCQHFRAAGMEIDEQADDQEQLLAWLDVPAFLHGNTLLKVLIFVLPAATLSCIVGAFFVETVKPVAIILALLQWAILGFYIKRINAFHEYISRKKSILEKYAHILNFLEKEKFSSQLLQKLSGQALEADVKVKSLASLVSALNARLNAMTNLVVNSLLMYDMQCVYKLEKWKYDNAGNLKIWLEVIHQAEVLCSLGTFSFNHPSFTYPVIEQGLSIAATELGHPLIPEGECITNNVSVGERQSVLIITGANMAGKSTFLRTIGVNLVLALTGAPVCATSFRCPVIDMRSGMRTADSLKDHQSYFYAELNRLKTIMDELRSNKPLFILLDEILKGTNSTDKQSGSIALVRQLLPHPCLALIATHDLALGDLATAYPDQVGNFCFEATIENDQLSFDYKLKPGLAQKMNATFLMKKMGIIPP